MGNDEGSIKNGDEIRNISSEGEQAKRNVSFDVEDEEGRKEWEEGSLHYVLKGSRFKSKRIGIVNNETEAPGNGSWKGRKFALDTGRKEKVTN